MVFVCGVACDSVSVAGSELDGELQISDAVIGTRLVIICMVCHNTNRVLSSTVNSTAKDNKATIAGLMAGRLVFGFFGKAVSIFFFLLMVLSRST